MEGGGGWGGGLTENTDIPAPALIPLAGLASKAGGSCSKGSSDWSSGCACASSAACPFECAGDWRGSFPWTICLAGCPHNKEEGPRMVLVHVGYLVLPVFGSVRNRGMTSCMLFIFITVSISIFYPNPNPTNFTASLLF